MVRFTPLQITGNLRKVDLILGHCVNIGKAIPKLGISEQACFRWRKEYGGMRVDQARQLQPRSTLNGFVF